MIVMGFSGAGQESKTIVKAPKTPYGGYVLETEVGGEVQTYVFDREQFKVLVQLMVRALQ